MSKITDLRIFEKFPLRVEIPFSFRSNPSVDTLWTKFAPALIRLLIPRGFHEIAHLKGMALIGGRGAIINTYTIKIRRNSRSLKKYFQNYQHIPRVVLALRPGEIGVERGESHEEACT